MIMGLNNINTDAAGKFMEEVKSNLQVAKKKNESKVNGSLKRENLSLRLP
jgi:hypothetical protein